MCIKIKFLQLRIPFASWTSLSVFHILHFYFHFPFFVVSSNSIINLFKILFHVRIHWIWMEFIDVGFMCYFVDFCLNINALSCSVILRSGIEHMHHETQLSLLSMAVDFFPVFTFRLYSWFQLNRICGFIQFLLSASKSFKGIEWAYLPVSTNSDWLDDRPIKSLFIFGSNLQINWTMHITCKE